MNRSADTVGERAKSGLAFGVVFSMFVPLILLMGLLEGSWEFQRRSTVVHVGVLAVTYPLGALATGVLFHLLAPVIRWRPLVLAWGYLSTIPFASAVGLAVNRGYEHWTGGHSVTVLLVSALGLGLAASQASPCGVHRDESDARSMGRKDVPDRVGGPDA